MYFINDIDVCSVNACCMSLDGTYAVTGDSAGEICVWDIRNHALVTRTIAHDLGVNCIISGPQDLSDKGMFRTVLIVLTRKWLV